ncbi:MAG TPA: serine protease [Kribbellaceae bacterium]|jgi:V8-like Glu-specific endopeptidase
MKINDTTREREIANRWEQTIGQVANTAKAVATGRLEMANTADQIAERRERLRRRGIRLESIVGDDDSVWLTFFSRGLIASRAVGRVVRAEDGQPPVPVGTGVLIGRGLLLTNNHVIPEAVDAAAMAVQLGYEYDDNGGERTADLYRLAPAVAFHTDEDLDFTVVAVADLDGDPPGAKYGTVTLIEATGKALRAEILNVVHHPRGERKRASIRQNRMVAQDELWLRYTSDTREGSSGAPVFNDQWEMVALHHGGVERRDEAGNRLTRSGEVWTEAMGDDAIDYVANEGARVSRIIRALRNAGLEEPTKSVVDAALQKGAS